MDKIKYNYRTPDEPLSKIPEHVKCNTLERWSGPLQRWTQAAAGEGPNTFYRWPEQMEIKLELEQLIQVIECIINIGSDKDLQSRIDQANTILKLHKLPLKANYSTVINPIAVIKQEPV